MSSFKYENVDIIDFLEEKMKSNTENYQSDFVYDKEFINKAAVSMNPEHKNILWLSRKSGTHSMFERDVFIEGTSANITWKYFDNCESKDFLAIAVEITGKENGVIKGNCYELDYKAHICDVKNSEVKAKEEILSFKDGYKQKLSFPNNYFRTAEVVDKHRAISDIYFISEDEHKLENVLREQAEKRHIMKLGILKNKKLALDEQLSAIKDRKKDSSTNKETAVEEHMQR